MVPLVFVLALRGEIGRSDREAAPARPLEAGADPVARRLAHGAIEEGAVERVRERLARGEDVAPQHCADGVVGEHVLDDQRLGGRPEERVGEDLVPATERRQGTCRISDLLRPSTSRRHRDARP